MIITGSPVFVDRLPSSPCLCPLPPLPLPLPASFSEFLCSVGRTCLVPRGGWVKGEMISIVVVVVVVVTITTITTTFMIDDYCHYHLSRS